MSVQYVANHYCIRCEGFSYFVVVVVLLLFFVDVPEFGGGSYMIRKTILEATMHLSGLHFPWLFFSAQISIIGVTV